MGRCIPPYNLRTAPNPNLIRNTASDTVSLILHLVIKSVAFTHAKKNRLNIAVLTVRSETLQRVNVENSQN